jgi:hypothetical protein
MEMKIEEVIDRATSDERFAEQLSRQARSAQSAGLYSEEWREYMELFAENSDELALLTPHASQELGIKWTTITTLTTLTTTTTAGCATTTTTGTTTTTTDAPKYCDDEPPKVPKAIGAYKI